MAEVLKSQVPASPSYYLHWVAVAQGVKRSASV